MDDVPLTSLVVMSLTFAAAPSLGIALLFGGRGLIRAFVLLCVVAAGWLAWFFAFSGNCCPTGMEALALVIVPALVLLAGGWAVLAYLLVGVLSLLPDQRRGRRR